MQTEKKKWKTMKNISQPKVSVVMLTYFHEPYVRHALESIRMQKVNFPYEVLVGDDASKDGTQVILKEYARNYPDIFKVTLRKTNLGANRNAYDLLMRARGQYIAMLEGDDYWTDPEKLQTQVDFLDSHPRFIGCAHKCVVVNEKERPDYTASPHWTIPKKIFTLDDFLKQEETPGQSSTEVFRNIFLDKSKDYTALYRVHPIVGDKTRTLMLLSQGNYYCWNKVMSAYRFVIKKDGKNWFSIHHSNPNWQCDAFMRPVRLQKYAKTLGIHANIGPRRDYHYVSLLDTIMKEPTLTRLKHFAKMTVCSGRPLHCMNLIGKYFILK